MSYRIEFDSGQAIVRLAFRGLVSEALFLEGTEAGRDVVRNRRAKGVIVDFTSAQGFDFPASFLRNYAASTTAVLPSSARVLVAPSDAIYGLARLFEIYRDPHDSDTNVVRSIEEAYSFLEIAPPDFQLVEDSGSREEQQSIS